MFSLTGFLKGILLEDPTDRSKQLAITVSPSATTGTTTTIVAQQTHNVTVTLPNSDLDLDDVPTIPVLISQGGTGQTTAPAAINALLPSQGGNAGDFLQTNGTVASWAPAAGAGTVTDFAFTNGAGFTGSVSTPNTTPTLSLTGTLTGDVTGALTSTALTATTNSTLTTLSALSLPGSQVTGNISGNSANVTGVVAIPNGGTGQTTANTALNALLPNQATNAGKFLSTDGSDTSWQSVAGASFKAPTIQQFIGPTSGTYTTPTSPAPLYIRVIMAGAGGGGAGGGDSTATPGSNGTADTIFGVGLLEAGAGGGGNQTPGLGGSGGNDFSIGAGAAGLILAGGTGSAGFSLPVTALAFTAPGAMGGSNPFGSSQFVGVDSGGAGGFGGLANSSATLATASGSGGGAGAYVDAIIYTPAATYPYSIGDGGAGGSPGGSGTAGQNGLRGFLIVYEYYQ